MTTENKEAPRVRAIIDKMITVAVKPDKNGDLWWDVTEQEWVKDPPNDD